MQSAVSSNWRLREQGIEPLPVHFAQINQRDGFFIVGRRPEPEFHWKNLEGKTLLADHGLQPLVMLKYAVKQNGADWTQIKVTDAGTPDKMEDAFRTGASDYVHLQGPVLAGEIGASVGASMPPVAFSSLCCTRAYQKTEGYRTFLKTYERARDLESNRTSRRNRSQGDLLFSWHSCWGPGRDNHTLSGPRLLGRRYRNPTGSLQTSARRIPVRRCDWLAASLRRGSRLIVHPAGPRPAGSARPSGHGLRMFPPPVLFGGNASTEDRRDTQHGKEVLCSGHNFQASRR